jgi:Family of unknown function (DUF6526)
MAEQSYKKHAKYVPMFHGGLFLLIVITLIGSLVNLYRHMGDGRGRTTLVLLVIIAFAMLLQFFFSRTFATTVQDRAIRAEENLRHFALTGKLFDPRLTIKQIVALRFAPDAEFVDLSRKAAEQGLSMDDIKKSVKNWRVDNDRV